MWKKLIEIGCAFTFISTSVFCISDKFGHVSYPANSPIEDRYVCNQLRGNRLAAVFDGHGGWQVSEYLQKHISKRLEDVRNETKKDWQSVLSLTFDQLENELRDMVRGTYKLGFGKVASVGSCAIVALVLSDHYVIANAGDCQAILVTQTASGIKGENICEIHSSNLKSEQDRLAQAHPNEPDIVRCRSPTACYVKGRLMPTRSFGDFHLKHEEFNNPEGYSSLHGFNRSSIPNFTGPYITHEPDIKIRSIQPGDKFLILASDGLWDEMNEQEAAEIVASANNPQEAADLLLERALSHAALTNAMTREGIARLPLGQRRSYHDDITIVVVPLA